MTPLKLALCTIGSASFFLMLFFAGYYFYRPAVEENAPIKTAQDVMDIPFKNFRDITYDKYFEIILSIAKGSFDKETASIDVEATRAKAAREEEQISKEYIKRLSRYDTNTDGLVTLAEMQEKIAQFQLEKKGEFGISRTDMKERADRDLATFASRDLDNDKVLTLDEMGIVPDHQKYRNKYIDTYVALTQLDENFDGEVTVPEIERSARLAFNAVDTNQDGVATKREIISVLKNRTMQTSR